MQKILGTLYIDVSEDFQKSIYPIARTIKAEKHDLAVVYAVGGADMEERKLGNIYGFDGGNYAGNVYEKENLSPTIRTFQGGNQQPMIVAMRGRNPDTSVQKDHLLLETGLEYRIRKLTPLECWRLMGFSDEDFYMAEEVNSNSQLYKQAGNSIVKNVLMDIFGEMLPRKGDGIDGEIYRKGRVWSKPAGVKANSKTRRAYRALVCKHFRGWGSNHQRGSS